MQTKNTTLVATSMKQEKDTKHLNTVNISLRNKKDNLVITNKSLNDNITQLNKVIKDQKELQTILSTDLSSEKTAHNKTKQDLNKSITLNTKKITTAVKEGNALKKKITSLSNSKKIAESALTKEKNSHNKENKELHALINKKRKEITNLSDQIDQLNQVLITEKENSKKVKNCALNVMALSKELAKKNKKITSLKKIQTQHNSVVAQKNKNISNLSKHNEDLQVEVEILKAKTSDQQKTNKELKQLFVYKDFEVNGVKPSEVLKSNKKIYLTPKELKNQNQIYAVQFGVFMQIQPYATLKRLEDVWYETTEHGTYVYLSGQFTSPEKATVHKNTLVKLGYPNAFVVQLAK